MVDLRVEIAPGLTLANPVMSASGTFGYGNEFSQYLDISKLGAVVTKGLSLVPKSGNPGTRLCETAAGMLNAIGLENIGADRFLEQELPQLQKQKATVIVNIFGNSEEQYYALTEKLDEVEGLAGLEINISCPNVKAGGIQFGTDPRSASSLVAGIRRRTKLPLITKLSPNVTDITEMAKAVSDAGSDAISLINTLLGMAVDLRTSKPILGNFTGGLSGPAIKPVALRMVYQVARAVSIPVIGLGGIMTAHDAMEFLLVGARAVQIGTANFTNPRVTVEILAGIEEFLAARGLNDINDYIDSLQDQ